MKKIKPDIIYIIIIICLGCFFFWPFFIKGRLPVPSDTLVGIYHPWRDYYNSDYPRGMPYKNFLITDPVRQQIPWRKISIDEWKKGNIPFYNPYSLSGTSLSGNIQAGVFYPLNLIFFVLPFISAWSVFIIFQIVFSGIFFYLFMRTRGNTHIASLVGSISWSYSSFSIVWLTWGTLVHTSMWIPLTLLTIEKILTTKGKKQNFPWAALLVFSYFMMLTAGHVQIALYGYVLSIAYFFWRVRNPAINSTRNTKLLIFFTGVFVSILLTSVQWIPMANELLNSLRIKENILWQKDGWFIPIRHLVQILIPDFFGNPSTGNYWGTWNYGEMTLYAGLIPIVFSLISIIFSFSKQKFWIGILAFSILFSTKNPISGIPFVFQIPVLSALQPTRLILLAILAISVMTGDGFDQWKQKFNRQYVYIGLSIFLILGLVFGAAYISSIVISDPVIKLNLNVSLRNIILPLLLSGVLVSIFVLAKYFTKQLYQKIIYVIILFFIIFDIFRFGWKFTPFTENELFFPETSTVKFLLNQVNNSEPFRIASLDKRLMPPNTSAYFGLETIEGYDSLISERYEEFMAAFGRGIPDIKKPFGFDRIVQIENCDIKLLSMMNVKYVLSLTDPGCSGMQKVFEEGQTKVFGLEGYSKRFHFVRNVVGVNSKQDSLTGIFQPDFDPSNTAFVEGYDNISGIFDSDSVISIENYSNSSINIRVSGSSDGFLVLSIPFDKKWKIKLDGNEKFFYRANYIYMGIEVPEGSHTLQMSYNPYL